MKFSLNRSYLEEFLEKLSQNRIDDIDLLDLKEIIVGAYSWEYEVSLIVYFYSKRIQKKQNNYSLDLAELTMFYNLNNDGYFNYQEFDRDFVSYLFDYSRSKINMSLEEVVVTVQQDFVNNKYDSHFRY